MELSYKTRILAEKLSKRFRLDIQDHYVSFINNNFDTISINLSDPIKKYLISFSLNEDFSFCQNPYTVGFTCHQADVIIRQYKYILLNLHLKIEQFSSELQKRKALENRNGKIWSTEKILKDLFRNNKYLFIKEESKSYEVEFKLNGQYYNKIFQKYKDISCFYPRTDNTELERDINIYLHNLINSYKTQG